MQSKLHGNVVHRGVEFTVACFYAYSAGHS